MAYVFHAVQDGLAPAQRAAERIQRQYEAFLDGAAVATKSSLAQQLVDLGAWVQPFDWPTIRDPLGALGSDQLAAHLDTDAQAAETGYHAKKAATNGVWRDLRWCLSLAVDNGGLTADSARHFRSTYGALHNRFANGAAPAVMRRVAALARAGQLVVLRTREVTARPGEPFAVGTDLTALDVLFEGYLPPFSPTTTAGPLYRNLLATGLLRLGRDGLDVTAANHPIRADGTADPRLTILGPALEGTRSFQISALRPGCNHEVIRQITAWCNDIYVDGARRHPDHLTSRKVSIPL
jgi:hypothetical protein